MTVKEQIQEIFNVETNNEEYIIKKNIIIYVYKEEHNIPQNRGANLCEVIRWAEANWEELITVVDTYIAQIDTNR